jgi:hypothetical protein
MTALPESGLSRNEISPRLLVESTLCPFWDTRFALRPNRAREAVHRSIRLGRIKFVTICVTLWLIFLPVELEVKWTEF